MANIALWILLIISGLFLAMIWGQVFKSKGRWRTFILVAGIIIGIYAVIGILGSYGFVDLQNAGVDKLFLATTGAGAGVQTNNSNPTIPVVSSGNTFVIGTLKATAKEKYSNSYTNVGSGTQFLKIYDANTDPSSPTASAIDKINISAGSGSSTNKLITVNTPYRVVFDGAGTWYDKDFGVIVFDSARYNAEASELLFQMGDIAKVGTIDDMLDEVNSVNGDINGQSSSVAGTAEVGNVTTDSLVYDISVGDGQFYIQPTLAFSGAYTEVKNPVLCFQRDITNPPEGNEMSSITYQHVTGTDLGLPSELVSYWSNEECVLLGAQATGGQSSKIKLTFTVDETNTDANDDWYLYLDDLSDIRGKDSIVSNSGATLDSIKFDAQA